MVPVVEVVFRKVQTEDAFEYDRGWSGKDDWPMILPIACWIKDIFIPGNQLPYADHKS